MTDTRPMEERLFRVSDIPTNLEGDVRALYPGARVVVDARLGQAGIVLRVDGTPAELARLAERLRLHRAAVARPLRRRRRR